LHDSTNRRGEEISDEAIPGTRLADVNQAFVDRRRPLRHLEA